MDRCGGRRDCYLRRLRWRGCDWRGFSRAIDRLRWVFRNIHAILFITMTVNQHFKVGLLVQPIKARYHRPIAVVEGTLIEYLTTGQRNGGM